MSKLVLSLNGVVQGDYPLTKERMTIGRKAANDIAVDNLAVSGKHALVITILDDSFLEDLGSTNGTFVNGKVIKKHALRNGDVISIGKHEIRYVNEHATADDDEFEKTIIMRPGTASAAAALAKAIGRTSIAPSFGAAASPSLLPVGSPLGRLNILNGPVAGKQLELIKASITLGKPGVQVAVISRRPQGYFITHIEGGTAEQPIYPVINGQPIGARSHQLKDRDVIELAAIKMEFLAV